MDLDEHPFPTFYDAEDIAEDAQLAVASAASAVRRAATMLTVDSRNAPLIAELDQLLERLDRHDDQLQTLSLSFFRPTIAH